MGFLRWAGCLLFLTFLAGCIAPFAPMSTPTPAEAQTVTNITESIILPHSGENVSLSGTESVAPYCCYYMVELRANESGRGINYSREYGGGHGGGSGTEIIGYADSAIAYTFMNYTYNCYAGYRDARRLEYNCTRGSCNFAVALNYTQSSRTSIQDNETLGRYNCTSQDCYLDRYETSQTLCFANGTYAATSSEFVAKAAGGANYTEERYGLAAPIVSQGEGCPCAYDYADICNGCAPS